MLTSGANISASAARVSFTQIMVPLVRRWSFRFVVRLSDWLIHRTGEVGDFWQQKRQFLAFLNVFMDFLQRCCAPILQSPSISNMWVITFGDFAALSSERFGSGKVRRRVVCRSPMTCMTWAHQQDELILPSLSPMPASQENEKKTNKDFYRIQQDSNIYNMELQIRLLRLLEVKL